jgi:hypothetical protein
MGMFDRLYDERGHDWQTKAFDRNLDRYSIGDPIPCEWGVSTFQVEVLGDPEPHVFVYSFATVRGGVLTSVNDERDPSLPLLTYGGGLMSPEGI